MTADVFSMYTNDRPGLNISTELFKVGEYKFLEVMHWMQLVPVGIFKALIALCQLLSITPNMIFFNLPVLKSDSKTIFIKMRCGQTSLKKAIH